ncbi:RNA polymerase sigma factor [Pedobacter frigoris]|uniref:RNA polymerase sigma-70 factor n=1 Tax=Pedobacter frigoris TaxID=2571272 RepID=A0A4U1CLD3_9SPHI|nr:RNA polymerase sigma-70 factor [Pedobacter frigoris]TKC05980.1 RNA polymerase sigma-70 factor [Pedobacter frigoris]
MTENHDFSDVDLLSLFKRGDQSAFKLIYERYWQLLYVSACKILKDEDEAKDIVQEVFISFLNKRANLEITISISSYLYSSVRYKVFDFISRKKVRQDHLDSLSAYIYSGDLRTDRALIEKEINAEIEKEIQNLPQKMKEVFELSRKEELSHKEIADTLNISDKTVKKQISNALKLLKPRFTNYYSIILMVFFKLF